MILDSGLLFLGHPVDVGIWCEMVMLTTLKIGTSAILALKMPI